MRMVAHSVFDRLANAIDTACEKQNYLIATQAAVAEGLKQTDSSSGLSMREIFSGDFEGATITLDFRSYDQSQAFSIRPDMNKFRLTLNSGGKELRQHAKQYED